MYCFLLMYYCTVFIFIIPNVPIAKIILAQTALGTAKVGLLMLAEVVDRGIWNKARTHQFGVVAIQLRLIRDASIVLIRNVIQNMLEENMGEGTAAKL
jgi:hypothetical protein